MSKVQKVTITDAIRWAGSQSALARATGYSQAAICKALKRGQVSAELAFAIHDASKGKVSKSALRPDVFPPRIKRT